MEIPVLLTPRLLLRPVTLDDAPAVQALFPHWSIVRLLSANVPWPYPPEGALTHLRDNVMPRIAEGLQWQWSLRLREAPDSVIGMIALMDSAVCNRVFWLGEAWQGQGLMSEASQVATDYWFEELERPLMRVVKAAENLASCRISRHQGMRLVREGERDFVAGRLPAQLWEISREEWSRVTKIPTA